MDDHTDQARKPRADAVRNRERVLEAAKLVFNAGGSEASLETVAKDRKSTRLNSSHANISYAVFCLKKKQKRLSRDPYHNRLRLCLRGPRLRPPATPLPRRARRP